MGEVDGSGTILRRHVPGPGTDEWIVSYDGSGTTSRSFLFADERGSVLALANSSGTVSDVNVYDEYGIPGVDNAGRFQYTGQAWLPELGMYNYKARIYSPTLGRFMQTDPIGYGDGMNWYNYVGSDPVNFSDPTGLFRCGFVEVGRSGTRPSPRLDNGDNEIVVTARKQRLVCEVEHSDLFLPDAWLENWLLVNPDLYCLSPELTSAVARNSKFLNGPPDRSKAYSNGRTTAIMRANNTGRFETVNPYYVYGDFTAIVEFDPAGGFSVVGIKDTVDYNPRDREGVAEALTAIGRAAGDIAGAEPTPLRTCNF